MVQYTLPQNPDIVITVPGKDSSKAREKAMDQLVTLMEQDQLGTDLMDGFAPSQFIEVKEPEAVPEEDEVMQAIHTLNSLATLKLKVQESRADALHVRELVDLLFSDADVAEEDITRLKDGFKILKSFAQANLRFREARSKAVESRAILDRALHTADDVTAETPPTSTPSD